MCEEENTNVDEEEEAWFQREGPPDMKDIDRSPKTWWKTEVAN